MYSDHQIQYSRQIFPTEKPTAPLVSTSSVTMAASTAVISSASMVSITFASHPVKPSVLPPPLKFSSRSIPLVSRGRFVQCKAVGESSGPVYQGVYGPWTVEPTDVREVVLYRSGLVTAASSFVIASSTAFLPENFWLREQISQNLDFFYALGAGGLGLSLVLIHIYVTEIKRTLQAFWGLGVVGSLAAYTFLAQPAGENLVHYVVDNPSAVWFVGPLFAALTGLVFKEGLCYGKLEAGILTFIIPTVLLGHLSGLMNGEVKTILLGSWMALFMVFAARKFTQPIKDDIGDKSVFMFNALPENEKKSVIARIKQQNFDKEAVE